MNMDSCNAERATDHELWDIAQSVYEPGSRSTYAPYDHPDLIDGYRDVYDAGRDDASASRNAEVEVLREHLAAAEAVIEQLRNEANAIIDTTRINGTDFERGQENVSERVFDVLSVHPSSVLAAVKADAWDEGAEIVLRVVGIESVENALANLAENGHPNPHRWEH